MKCWGFTSFTARAEDVRLRLVEVTVMQVNSDLGPIGAEVSGIDLAQPLSDASIENIRRAWLDHGVLVFRNQTLSPKAQSAFSRRDSVNWTSTRL